MGTIVVGIDDSQTSRAALAWALEEAKLRTCELVIVHCWQVPVVVGPEMVYVPPPARALLLDDVQACAQKLCDAVGVTNSGVDYRIELPEGRAGAELVQVAGSADLLVVGTHGSGSVRELLLGSTSSYCVHHSVCPVVVVRAKQPQ